MHYALERASEVAAVCMLVRDDAAGTRVMHST